MSSCSDKPPSSHAPELPSAASDADADAVAQSLLQDVAEGRLRTAVALKRLHILMETNLDAGQESAVTAVQWLSLAKLRLLELVDQLVSLEPGAKAKAQALTDEFLPTVASVALRGLHTWRALSLLRLAVLTLQAIAASSRKQQAVVQLTTALIEIVECQGVHGRCWDAPGGHPDQGAACWPSDCGSDDSLLNDTYARLRRLLVELEQGGEACDAFALECLLALPLLPPPLRLQIQEHLGLVAPCQDPGTEPDQEEQVHPCHTLASRCRDRAVG